MAEMEVDGDSLPTQQSGSSNASVNPSPTTETSNSKKVNEGKKTEKRKQKADTSEAWQHFTRDPMILITLFVIIVLDDCIVLVRMELVLCGIIQHVALKTLITSTKNKNC
uniref:Uncharacterized protein n=1 Tax=Lactuca sativa TaxID=4236 RepID=A0A9R1XP75_LACSA|nr:hypothetical protein LSAT_V11C200094010 [Lactuca sativa]